MPRVSIFFSIDSNALIYINEILKTYYLSFQSFLSKIAKKLGEN